MRSLAILIALAVSLPVPALADWVIEAATSAADGSASVWTTIDAAESPQSGLGTDMPGRLLVGCARAAPPAPPPGRLGLRLAWRPAVPLGGARVPVRYRLDGGRSAEEAWLASDEGDSVARAGDAHLDLVAALGTAAELRIEVVTPRDGALAWRIDLTAARPALIQVLAHCVGAPLGEDLTVAALAGRFREAAEARARALRAEQARIREAAAARERAVAAYADQVRRAVTAYWVPPEDPPDGAVRVSLTVARGGRVLAAGLEEASDDAAFDWSVVSALDKVRETGLPPLPPEVEGERLEIEVVLEPPTPRRAR